MISGTTAPEPEATDATTATTTTYHATDGQTFVDRRQEEPEVRAVAVDGGHGGSQKTGTECNAQSNAFGRSVEHVQSSFFLFTCGSNPHHAQASEALLVFLSIWGFYVFRH